jgi:MFS family permease
MAASARPRFGYSIVAAAFAAQALAIGLTISAYPLFMDALEREFGASRAQTSFGIPLLLLAAAVVSPFVGRRIDTASPRQVMIAGAVLILAGLLGVAWAPSLAIAAAMWVCLVGPGHAMLGPLPAMTVLANWFVERRGQMIAIAAMGTTFGGALVPPLAERLIVAFGWRGAVVCFALACVAIGVPVVLLGIVKKPEELGLYPDGAATAPEEDPTIAGDEGVGRFFRDRNFWLLAASFGLMMGVGISFITHSVPLAIERGISREQAVLVLTVNAIFAAAGKLLFGTLSDRLGPRGSTWIAVGVQAVGWSGLILAASAPLFIAGAAIFALGLGCMIPCQASFVASLYGRKRFGQASGLMGMFAVIGGFVMPPLIGAGYDATGSYGGPISLALAAVVAPALLLGLIRSPRKELASSSP